MVLSRGSRVAGSLTVVTVAFVMAGVSGTVPVRSVAAQVVRGQVADSTTGNPLAGASVFLLNEQRLTIDSSITDSAGLFLFPIGQAGRFRLRAQQSGYETSTFPEFDGSDVEERSFLLLLPSPMVTQWYESVLSDACPGSETRGTVVGWVRHAETRVPIPNATINVSWASVPNFLADAVSVGEFSGEARADSTGMYVICGAPIETRVWLHAVADSAFSNFLSLTFQQGSVNTGQAVYDAPGNVWRQDLSVYSAAERNTTIRGVVTSDLSGTPVPGATVGILGTEFITETDSAGVFMLPRLPGGPIRLTVRRIGSEGLRREFFLPSEGEFDIAPGELMLGAAQVLDPVVVETTPGHNPLAEFNSRRTLGNGSFLTREEFTRQGTPITAVDVLRRMQGVRIRSGGDLDHRWIISLQRGGPRTFGTSTDTGGDFGAVDIDLDDVNPCPPLVFLDRHYIGNVNQIDVDGAIPLETVAAVEAHQSAATLPYQYSRPGSSCGVIAFWTRFAETRSMEVNDDPRSHRSLLDSTGFHVFLAVAGVVGIFIGLGKAIHF